MLSQPTRLFGDLVSSSKKKKKKSKDFKCVNVKEILVAALLGQIFEVAGADVASFSTLILAA